MSDQHEVTVRAQELDGTWQTFGAGRYRGVVPEGLSCSWNEWGPDVCGFTLRRDAGFVYPDLGPWTPVEVEVAGQLAWDGRVRETPSQEGTDSAIGVQCEGWQYHLDDDVYAANYVHSRLSDFVDQRSFPIANLAYHRANRQVQVGEGQILLMLPLGENEVASTAAAATLDLGPGCSADTISIDIATSFNTANHTFYLMGTDTPDWVAQVGRMDWKAAIALNNAVFGAADSVQTLTTTTVASPKRYIHIIMFTAVAGGLTGADVWLKVTGLRAARQAAYISSGASVLSARDVVVDALSRTVFLTDTSGVQAGTFSIPESAMQAPQSFREVLNGANAYENYRLQVGLGQRVVFAPRSTAPVIEVGQWSGADFADASANSGDDIQNRALVQGTGPDGQALSVERFSVGQQDYSFAQLANPSAAVDASNWTASVGAWTRNTGTFDSSPAAFMATMSAGGLFSVQSATVTQPITRGVHYRLAFAFYVASLSGASLFTITIVDQSGNVMASWTRTGSELTATGGFSALTYDWAAPLDATGYAVRFSGSGGTSANVYLVDSIVTTRHIATMADRRKFTRAKILPVGTSITSASGARLGDLYLEAHKTTPLRGGLKVVGQGGVRRVLGGGSVHPAHIQSGMVLRVAHVTDPDTGGQGRDGTITTVQYDHDSLMATVTLGSNRAGFDTLLTRLAAVVGQGNR